MQQRIRPDEWLIVQDGFDATDNRVFESLFSLGNGHFGGRGNHEEAYTGDSLRGNYVAGIYYPDPTRVGWWKNGYPDYFAKILNAADWTPIRVEVDDQPLDLAAATIHAYRRTLHMREGELARFFCATLPNGRTVEVDTVRFVSMTRPHLGAIRYRITPIDGDADVTITSAIDADVVNEDSNYDDGFWEEVTQQVDDSRTTVVARTKKTGFVAGTAADTMVTLGTRTAGSPWTPTTRTRFASTATSLRAERSQTIEVVKYAAIVTSRTVDESEIVGRCHRELDEAAVVGFDGLRSEHAHAWARKWDISDVVIGGDPAAQQGIRFNIFQLNATFTGDDPDLNIGPKGFTGEKYGGVTYWDTEAFCLPFYLATSEPHVARNLLRYRHRQLGRAIENAAKLGFHNGAALFPMVTINGEECHNEWEITFEEIHRNGAVAFAVFDYLRYTGDDTYLLEGGLEVLIAISRFWVQRVSRSEHRQAWVMLGVTGPNEYENNVDNNWYTSLMAQWTLRYTAEAIDLARELDADATRVILSGVGLDERAERARWSEVAAGIHLPEDPERRIFLQQSNYLDKELLTVDDLDPAERPINKHWSWDRILRSCFIKQADVLQGLWVLEDHFDLDTIRRNFDFYEPRTVHESSLSPSVHAVLAVRLGRLDKSHEMMLRTARLDLDDYNHDTDDGCHTTSMAGTWIAVVHGFGGMRVVDGRLQLDPVLAPGWTSLGFQIRFRGAWLSVMGGPTDVVVEHRAGPAVDATVFGEVVRVAPGDRIERSRPAVDTNRDRPTGATTIRAPVRRVLVVANQTVGGADLATAVVERLRAGACEFHLLVPYSPTSSTMIALGSTAVDVMPATGFEPLNERLAAEERLAVGFGWFQSLGASITGEVVPDGETVHAVRSGVTQRSIDEVIVSTLPRTVSRWLRQDLPHRITRKVSVPVTVVTSRT